MDEAFRIINLKIIYQLVVYLSKIKDAKDSINNFEIIYRLSEKMGFKKLAERCVAQL